MSDRVAMLLTLACFVAYGVMLGLGA